MRLETQDADTQITGLSADSRSVSAGYLFAALPGTALNGADFIEDAIDKGAAAILADVNTATDMVFSRPVAIIEDPNPRRRFALMASRFHRTQPKTICAVTGTNGKTSVAAFTRQIWQHMGLKAASLGTLGVKGNGIEIPGSLTTPDPVSLYETLAQLSKKGIDHLALEASSHGLEQYRLDGVHLAAAAFTNLTRDHLDYHGDMGRYLDAKKRLFTELLGEEGTAVINVDVMEGQLLAEICATRGIKVITYGRSGTDIHLINAVALKDGQQITFTIGEKSYQSDLPLAGDFQVMNVLCALGLVIACGGNAQRAAAAIAHLDGVPGRLQRVARTANGATVYVDYAHTPDALENVLAALRPHVKGRLHVLFGCGGDRDPGKRPLMGEIAGRLADHVIVSDDNPRSEDPARIRKEILAEILTKTKSTLLEIGDRAEAITAAINALDSHDLLVIAGKGHETCQIIGTQKFPFDDAALARQAAGKDSNGNNDSNNTDSHGTTS